MLLHEPADFIKTFVTDLNVALGKLKPNDRLTHLQTVWLGFCLTAMLLTNSVCWAKFERASLGEYKIAALSWMFREAKSRWKYFESCKALQIYLRRLSLNTGQCE